MTKTVSYIVGAAFLLAAIFPVLSTEDGFPLSTYPMFSGRQEREATITHAVAMGADGSRTVLPPRTIANDEVIQAFETLRKAARSGRRASEDLCDRIASRLSGARLSAIEVQIVSDRYDAVAYFSGEKRPRSSLLHARCEVPSR